MFFFKRHKKKTERDICEWKKKVHWDIITFYDDEAWKSEKEEKGEGENEVKTKKKKKKNLKKRSSHSARGAVEEETWNVHRTAASGTGAVFFNNGIEKKVVKNCATKLWRRKKAKEVKRLKTSLVLEPMVRCRVKFLFVWKKKTVFANTCAKRVCKC